MGRTSKNVAKTSKNVEKRFTALREQVISFVKGYYEEHSVAPPIRIILKSCKTYTGELYKAFPGKLQEICEAAGVPVPEKRMSQVEKATAARREIAAPDHGKLPIEIQAEEAEAALEVERKRKAALEQKRKADAERLELEAEEDPKRVVAYLRTLEPEIVAPFFDLCKEAGVTPRRAWAEAVGVLGQTWEEWGRIIRADGEEPYLKGYVMSVIETFIPQKRLKLAKERHREDVYTFTCWRCDERYEFQVNKKGALISCPNSCRTREGHESFYNICPVCRDLGKENLLFYDLSRNFFYCEPCGHRTQVKGPPLNPKGTKNGTLTLKVTELEERVKSLNGELRDLQRRRESEARRVEELKRSRVRFEKLNEKIRQKWTREAETLSAETEEKRQECAAELRRAEELKGENKHASARREVFNAVAEFLMDPELITGEQLANVVITLSAALKMRGQQGHVGESVKMTAEVRDRLLKRIAGGRYVLKDESEKRLEQELAKQQRKYNLKLKAKDTTIDAERRRRETAEKERAALMPWRDEDMKKVKKENRRLRDQILRLEGKNSDVKHELHLQRIMASS